MSRLSGQLGGALPSVGYQARGAVRKQPEAQSGPLSRISGDSIQIARPAVSQQQHLSGLGQQAIDFYQQQQAARQQQLAQQQAQQPQQAARLQGVPGGYRTPYQTAGNGAPPGAAYVVNNGIVQAVRGVGDPERARQMNQQAMSGGTQQQINYGGSGRPTGWQPLQPYPYIPSNDSNWAEIGAAVKAGVSRDAIMSNYGQYGQNTSNVRMGRGRNSMLPANRRYSIPGAFSR